MNREEIEPGTALWAADTENWGPELVEVVCVKLDSIVVRREDGTTEIVGPWDCHPTLANSITFHSQYVADRILQHEEGARRYRDVADRIRRIGDSIVAPTPLLEVPLTARIAGPGALDLADLPAEALTLPPVEPAWTDIYHDAPLPIRLAVGEAREGRG